MSGPAQNTDTELWRDDEGNSIRRTIDGMLGIGVHGFVQVAPLASWVIRPQLPHHTDDDLDYGYVAHLAAQTKVDRGSVSLVLGAHLANQHQAEHARGGRADPRAYGSGGRPVTFPPNVGEPDLPSLGEWAARNPPTSQIARNLSAGTIAHSPAAFEFDREHDGSLPIAAAVYQALGAASMCWSETPAGVFDSRQADRVGEALLAVIREDRETR